MLDSGPSWRLVIAPWLALREQGGEVPAVDNLTRFGVAAFPSVDRHARDVLVVCVAGRFKLPAPGTARDEPPVPADEQLPPVLEDVYWGEHGGSSLRAEGQSAYSRPGTDIYLSGHAWSPRGRPVKEMLVGVRVGPCRAGILVMGERVWRRGITGLRPSEPEPFESMPLRYERSFGGAQVSFNAGDSGAALRNPVGKGLYASAREAVEQPLPNLEDPERRIERVTDRVPPAGFGPIARNWHPRLKWAGTYDAAWTEHRAPLWPEDFDERFFLAAAPGLVSAPWLEGGEPVVLSGLSPEGRWVFPLPRFRLTVKTLFRHRMEHRRLVLDALHLEPDAQVLTLYWRAAIPAHRQMAAHELCVVRELEDWEDFPS